MHKDYDSTQKAVDPAHYKALLDQLPGAMGVYYVYPNDRVELCHLNEQFYAMLDIARADCAEYGGFCALDPVEPKDRAELLRRLRTAVDQNIEIETDVRIRLKNGRDHWLCVRATVAERLPDKTAVYARFSDATLEKEAQVRFARESRLRKELVKDAVISYRINLNTQMVEELYSEAFETADIALPISMSQLIERGLFKGCYPPDRPLLQKMLDPKTMLENYESGKRGETFTYRRDLPRKGLRWLKASIAKLKRVDTDEVIAFFTAMDIDEEHKDRILYRDVMNEEIESLITLQVNTGRVRILKENRTLSGYTPDHPDSSYFAMDAAFRDSLFQDVLPEELSAAAAFISLTNVRRELETQAVLQHTYCTRAPGGTIRRKKVRVFYLDESKQDIIFVRRDITDLYNEQQRQSAAIQAAMNEAKQANEAKSVFLSRMSHDMRTPLNAIIGYSGKTLRAGATEAQKDEFLDDIHSSGEYLLGIINDVLDMTKIESNKMVLHPEPYTCAAFKESMETVLLPLCAKKGVTFVTDFPKDINLPMLLDKVRFNQIFVNILSNAVKFTPAGGKITLTARRVERSDGKYDETFVVADTGCGMSKEFLPHAFDSFSQEYEGQSMHNEQGTGLGLSIVKQLVELMGGVITVESELGAGSTFTVKMPITPAGLAAVQQKRTFPQDGLRGRHLLLCEDHPMNQKIAVKLLEKEGCTVEVAGDGILGVQKFRESAVGRFDAVLMDIRMPGMDGLEAARAIRALPRQDAAGVPIIAMTANAFVEDRRASLAAGMNAHIAKPIDPAELYSTIYQLTAARNVARTPVILVVDDIEMNAALVARGLKGHYECQIALSGREALERLEQNPYIIAVITDVNMPQMDGGQLIRTIRKNPAYNRIALIANTQFGDSHTEEQIIKDGADDFIYKPTAPSLILSRVNNVLAKYR